MHDAWLKCFNWISTFVFSNFLDILQVNDNGYVSFGVDYQHPKPLSFTRSQAIIAPFWANTDNTCEGSGDVYYRETTANSILAMFANDIQSSLSLSSDFYPSLVVIATWHQVERFYCHYNRDYKVRIITLLTELNHSVKE